jgi:hypothetical protein
MPMSHPVEAAAETLIAALRAHSGSAELASDGPVLLPGLWSSHDAQQGALAGRCVAGAGALLRLELAVTRPGRWCTLSLALGDAALEEDAVVGVVAEVRAQAPCEIGLGLRSLTRDGPRDTGFEDRLPAGPESRAQVGLLTVPPASPLSDPARRRLLLLHLPQQSGWLEIRDLRLFVQPAAQPEPDSGPESVRADAAAG